MQMPKNRRIRSRIVRLSAVCGALIAALASVEAAAGPSLASGSGAQQLSLSERVACQASIERVYWRHRTWPGENSRARPSFADSVPAPLIRARAEDAVRKSVVLEQLWGVRISGRELQAELERIAAKSKSPGILRELFAALGNDPQLAAECLARPLLADRLLRAQYSGDERFHGALRTRAEAELANARAAAKPRVSGRYTVVEWRRQRPGAETPARVTPAVVTLDSSTFDQRVEGLRTSLAVRSGQLHAGWGALREDETRFYAVAVLAQDRNRVRMASVEWPKASFDSWWSQVREQASPELRLSPYRYTRPAVAPNPNCGDDSWQPTFQLLDARYWHTAVWTGTEMIVWGGMNSVGTLYRDGSRYNPATDTWTLISAKGAPLARQAHVAVWTGSEMIVWGSTSDRSGGRYEPVTDTWKPISTAGAPEPRSDATVVWTGKEMMVWGGQFGYTVKSGGRYHPTSNSWAPMALPPLAGRAYHAAVWTGKEMIVWGGYDGFIGQMYDDGARYTPGTNTWRRVSDAGHPNARYFHTAVWTGTEMIVWGGINWPNYDLSGGRYNPVTDTWRATHLANAPSLRWMHAAVWTGNEMIVQGGTPANPRGGRYDPASDTWSATTALNAPTNGQGITAVWTGEEMILWGGLDDDFVFHNDGGRYDPDTDSWVRTTTMNVPGPRGLHSAVWTGSEMIVWGGFGDDLLNTGGLYDPATDSWKPTTTVGAPAGRENAEAVWTGSEAIFWGGDPDGDPFTPGTGGRYNPATDSWRLTTRTNAPTNRYGHTAVWTGTEMIVFGGVGTDSVAKRYSPATDRWLNATTANAPGARDHHGAVWTGKEMVVWGGFINDGSTPTGGRYNPATNTWRPTNVGSSPPTRAWPISVWTGTEAIFWGGQDPLFGHVLNDGGRYDPVADTWRRTTMQGAPSPRIGQGVWTGTELLLWGGVFDSSGGRYNPANDSWRPTTRVNAPFVRGGGRWSTVWTGAQMIVWGGIIETQQGSLYCASGAANVAPVALDDSYTAARNRKLVVGNVPGVLANDTDENGDLLTAAVVAKPAYGTLTLNDNGSFLYKPARRYRGPDSFTYRAHDGVAAGNVARVTITVR